MIYEEKLSPEELEAFTNLKITTQLDTSLFNTMMALINLLSGFNKNAYVCHSWYKGFGYLLFNRSKYRGNLPRSIIYPFTYVKKKGIKMQCMVIRNMLIKQGYPKTKEDVIYSLLGTKYKQIDRAHPPKSLLNTQLQLIAPFKYDRYLTIDKVIKYLDKEVEKELTRCK